MARDTHLVCVCRRCGSWYDSDFHEALMCHDGDDDWAIVELAWESDGVYVYLTEEGAKALEVYYA
jgi:hypothetical protein